MGSLGISYLTYLSFLFAKITILDFTFSLLLFALNSILEYFISVLVDASAVDTMKG